VSIHLFEKCWDVVKRAEQTGELTVEEALDVATRLPQALFCSMMECLADNGEDPTRSSPPPLQARTRCHGSLSRIERQSDVPSAKESTCAAGSHAMVEKSPRPFVLLR
jgi:hypothetical protein